MDIYFSEEKNHRKVLWTSEATMKRKMVSMHTTYWMKCRPRPSSRKEYTEVTHGSKLEKYYGIFS